jgi:hypothetical protein
VKHYLSHGRCNAFTRREISCPGYTQAWSGYSEWDNPMRGLRRLGKTSCNGKPPSIQESSTRSSSTRWLSSTTTASCRLKILEEYELRRSTLHLRVKARSIRAALPGPPASSTLKSKSSSSLQGETDSADIRTKIAVIEESTDHCLISVQW